MLILAVTTMEKIKAIPPALWGKIALGLLAFVAGVLLLQRAMKMNKIVLSIILFMVFGVVGFQWIYERNEPKFMTPVVEKIAPFFPSKGSYDNKQQGQPKI